MSRSEAQMKLKTRALMLVLEISDESHREILSINIGDYENKIYRGALFKQLSNGLLTHLEQESALST